eukprot:7263033-Pyramimonas_sp.AAC.1
MSWRPKSRPMSVIVRRPFICRRTPVLHFAWVMLVQLVAGKRPNLASIQQRSEGGSLEDPAALAE